MKKGSPRLQMQGVRLPEVMEEYWDFELLAELEVAGCVSTRTRTRTRILQPQAPPSAQNPSILP